MRGRFLRIAFLLGLLPPLLPAQGSRFALRFSGTGSGQADRAKIPILADSAFNVGGDFTLEFWMRAAVADNAGSVATGQNGDGWITGNVIIDRDVYGPGDFGDYGIALGRSGGMLVLAFGVHNGSSGQTIVGTANVGDGQWHHVAVTRAASGNGRMRILVDGVEDAAADGPTGNIAYRAGRATSFPDSDPFLVLGAEKHDAGAEYPSFAGDLDELRIWSRVLSDAEIQAQRDRILDPATVTGLVGAWRFEEGQGTRLRDVSGQDAEGSLTAGQPGNGEWISWLAGQNAAPVHMFAPTLRVGGLSPFVLGFHGVTNVRYQVESAPGVLAPVAWTPIAQNLEADQAWIEVPLPAPSNQVLRVTAAPWR
jgi:hypothetical protein